MESNLADCFICGASCAAKCSNQGFYITKNLNMPLIAVLTRVLRTFETEAESNAYFCCDCVQKIKEYDNLIRLSSQIEAELNEKFENKPVKSSDLLDDHMFVDQNEIRNLLEIKSNLNVNDNTPSHKNEIVDLSITTTNDDQAEKLTKSIDRQSTGTIAFLNQFDDVQGLEIIAVVDNLNDIGEVQGVESIAVEIQQMEKLLSNEQQNDDDDEFSEFTSEEDDDDDIYDNSNNNGYVPEMHLQSINEELNTAKKTKVKTIQKAKRTKSHTQTVSLSCQICGRSYKTKGALGVHMVKHSDQNPNSKK